MDPRTLLLVCTGGAIGAGLRYLVNAGLGAWLGPRFPWWTLFANVTGCLAIGLLAGLLTGREAETAPLRAFLATGVLGGYTTFSAFSLDFANLLARGEVWVAWVYVAGSVGLSLAAVLAGLWIGRGLT